MSKSRKTLEKLRKSRDEIVSDLIQGFSDNIQSMNDAELVKMYEDYFGEEVEIVE